MAPVPSLHCQRIARAKWEFLFGSSTEGAAGRGDNSESGFLSVFPFNDAVSAAAQRRVYLLVPCRYMAR